ncbi:MAG: hypothetical protein DMF01_02035 [Verrucomicrobia bacterium]|nr:MAG: hypothetical protein DMF01_02035 [Verrucomicrobiota bacterium]
MKRVLQNVLALAGLLLIVASFVWMQLHRTERQRAAPQPRTTSPSAASKPFAVVVLDPGHGGRDSGAMCGGMLEKDLTLDVTRRIDRLLNSEGVAALMTRVGDTYVSLADRAAFANRARNCIFVQNLAGFIQEALVARTRAIDRGTQARQFFVIANVTSPAALVEGGFLTNKEDISKLGSEDYRDQIAAAVADGILRYREAASQRQSALAATAR